MKQAMGRHVRGPEWEPQTPEAASMSGEAVAKACSLLCSDDAAVITGAVIAMDNAASAGLLASSMIYHLSAELPRA
jgi:hypothetical protein